MGDPYFMLGDTAVEVDSYSFNMAMSVFREECAKRKANVGVEVDMFEQIHADILKFGYEQVAETAFHIDKYISNDRNRTNLILFLNELIQSVLKPGFELPAYWQKLISEGVLGATTQKITTHHFLRIAYIYQTMLDLIEGRIQERLVRRLTTPPDWQTAG